MNQNNAIDLNKSNECIKLINNALNKACKGGIFSIDEAYLIKIAFSNIEKIIESVNKETKLEIN